MGNSVSVTSPWERSGRLLGSALKLRTENKRSPEEWAEHLRRFVPGQTANPDDSWLRGEMLLGACLEKAHQGNLHEEWTGHLHGFVFDPRSGKFIRVNYADKRWRDR